MTYLLLLLLVIPALADTSSNTISISGVVPEIVRITPEGVVATNSTTSALAVCYDCIPGYVTFTLTSN